MKKLLIILLSLFVQNLYAQAPPNYPSAPAASGNINAIEYFIDTKPEFGSGLPLTGFTASSNVNAFNGNVNVNGLPNGFHRIYFRSKDVNNVWSLTNNAFFDNYTVPIYATAPAPSTNITNIEYYIDNNPSFGSGSPLTGFTASPNVNAFNGNVNVNGLPTGFHRLYIRSKDATNKWSLTQNAFFDNYTTPIYSVAPPTVTNIVAIEYFIDNNDLGFGNCTPISFTPNTNIVGLNANVNVTGLPAGVHRLFIRTKDANNKWSLTNFSVFDNSTTPNYPLAPTAAPAIAQMEYYIDNDPGFGNATSINVPGNTGTINNYSVNLSLSGSLSIGTHYLYIRSRQNPWSITNVVPFTAANATPVTWLYVKAQLQNKQSVINWATAQEQNANKFEIEFSSDGIHYTKVGEVSAANNSSTTKNYEFTHKQPVSGFNYYRIKQIDNNNNYKYSVVVIVLNKDDISKTIIAPNPVKDILHIVEPKIKKVKTVQVLSTNGALLISKTINSDVQLYSIPVQNLQSANYILKIIYHNTTQTYSFVKQ